MGKRILWFFVFVATTAIFAAEAPFFGSWKVSSHKTDFTAAKVKFEQMPNGEIKETDQGGITTTFKIDGKDYPTPTGATVAWKQLDANTWETVTKINGKVIETDTATLSADGKAASIVSKIASAEGKVSEASMTLHRVSGGPGLIGEWRGTTDVKMPDDSYLELTARGADAVVLTLSPPAMTCDARTDGGDYPCSGSAVPPGMTLSFKQTGPRSFQMVQKKEGNVLATIDGTVSDDGKTLTSSVRLGNAPASDAMKFVYDRVTSKPQTTVR